MITDDVIALLRTISIGGVGAYVGDADRRVPDGTGWVSATKFVPYYVVDPIPGEEYDGNLAFPDQDLSKPLQVTSFGATREQAQRLAIAARMKLTAAALGVARVIPDGGGGVLVDRQTDPPVFYVPDSYRLLIFA